MKPIRLELEGFTSFRERSEIDFSALDLFAITGATGAGKTSLLDAISFALYGKTPRLGKSAKELVSQGAPSMSVLLQFQAGAESYRVQRILRGSTPTVRLEKQTAPTAWEAIAGRVRDLDEQVQRIVGLDFEGFTKAVLLPQGKFDEFLCGDTAERRRILSDLLGLGIYGQMQRRANEKAKERSMEAGWKSSQVEATATREAKAAMESELNGLANQKAKASEYLELVQRGRPIALELRQHRSASAAHQHDLAAAGQKLSQAQLSARNAEKAIGDLKVEMEETARQIAALGYNVDLHLELNRLIPLASRRQEAGLQVDGVRIERQMKAGELAAMAEETRWAAEAREKTARELDAADLACQEAESAFAELRRKHGTAEAIAQVVSDLESIAPARTEQAEIEKRITALEQQAQAGSQEIDQLEKLSAEAGLILKEAEDHAAHIQTAVATQTLRGGLIIGEACPVCEQTVSKIPAQGDQSALADAKERVKAAQHNLRKAAEALTQKRSEVTSLPPQIESQRKHLKSVVSSIDTATAKARKILTHEPDAQAADLLRDLAAVLSDAESKANQAKAQQEARSQAARQAREAYQAHHHSGELLQQKIAGYDRQSRVLEEELRELDKVLHGRPGLAALENELRVQAAAKCQLDRLAEKRRSGEARLKSADMELSNHKTEVAVQLACLEKARAGIEAACQEIAKLEERLGRALVGFAPSGPGDEFAQLEAWDLTAREQVNALTSDMDHHRFLIASLAEKIEKNERLQAEIGQLREDAAVYHELGGLLNSSNFQQYLLKESFRLLAVEGSRHLEILSASRYSFACEGDDFVVQDHWNADEPRSVNTLSGGESFLASLALALALAGSIAELSGQRGAVALESLFLDEGFSTLDPETLSKVADSLQLLQTGNRLIGIITHIEALADQMPARIEIQKTVGGSRIIQGKSAMDLATAVA